MSGERQEHGPDFWCKFPRNNVVFTQLVNILVQKGYAVTLIEEKGTSYFAVHTSVKAREMIDEVMDSPEFFATEGAFRGRKRPRAKGSMQEVVEQCGWPESVKKSVLATYLYNREILGGQSEEKAERWARQESKNKVGLDDIPSLLSPAITRVEIEIAAQGILR